MADLEVRGDRRHDAPIEALKGHMAAPEFGSLEYKIMVALQRELVRAYVHFARRANFRSQSFRDPQNSRAFAAIEDEGLISALGRLRRLTKRAKVLSLLDTAAGQGLAALDSQIVEIRDQREHYDEYLIGEGRRPQNFVRTHTFSDGVSMRSDPMWSTQVGSEEVLGCRLAVNDLAQALNSFRLEVEAVGWLLPHTAPELARLASPA